MSLLARLIEAGTPADLIEEVAMLLAEKRVLETRRASERQRKQVQRDREKETECHVTSRDSTGQDGTSQETPSLSLPPNENNSNPPTHTHPDNTPRAKADPFPRPDWADPQVWNDWMAVRRDRKAKNTPTAYTGFLRSIAEEATDDWPPGRLLAHAVENSWKSIHRPKDYQNGHAHRQPHQNIRTSAGNGGQQRSSLAQAIDEGLEWLGSS